MARGFIGTPRSQESLPFGETESTWRFGPSAHTLPKVPHVASWGGSPLLWPRGSELYRPAHTPPPKAAWFWQPEASQNSTQHRRLGERHGRSHSVAASPTSARLATVGESDALYGHGRAGPDAVRHIQAPHPSTPVARPLTADQSSSSPSSARRERARHRRRQRPASSQSSSSHISDTYFPRDESFSVDQQRHPLPGLRDWQRAPAGAGSLTQDCRYAREPQLSYSRSKSSSLGASNWGHTLNAGFGREDSFTNNAFFTTGRQSHIPDLRRIAHTSPNRVTRVV